MSESRTESVAWRSMAQHGTAWRITAELFRLLWLSAGAKSASVAMNQDKKGERERFVRARQLLFRDKVTEQRGV